ncbi:NUDIX hydrolase [Coraliomargarita sinensis]|uniref:GDP-mannose pyrophosphatase n=1 Tax=Coraliomargarita sinensis TaxID=2174842 RepID=A0A317ZE07_9BACT|nr:NUDIX hydrolase [Coraliomargarita sinensis]PXA03614.1 NUDIX hydrolase [Coraliomargarita sinensis]
MAEDEKAPPRWDILDDKLLQACRVWDLRARHYRHPKTGKEGEFYYIDSRDWAIVVALTVDGEIVLVRQFRWGSDELSWELPGGIIDEGEDPVAAGLRELREETGYVAESGRIIGRSRPNPAILNNHSVVVLAEGCRLCGEGTAWDEHEEMEVRALPEATVMDWAREGVMTHALALNGLLYYQLQT